MVVPQTKWKIVDKTRELAKEFEQQYNDGLITQGEKYNKVVDAWSKSHRPDRRRDDEGNLVGQEGQGRARRAGQLDLHDGAFRRARLARADASARRHARPDGQAVGRDHREPDHLELQGRPLGARVLQLDPRRPQGSGRHRAEDRELGLPDAPSGRRRAGLHHHVARIAAPRPASRCAPSSTPAPWSPRWRSASSAAPRPRTSSDPATGKVVVKRDTLLDEPEVEAIVKAGVQELRIRSVLTCENDQRRVRQVLRARSRPRHAGQHGRGGRRDRGAVDRRAGHPAHHAHVPHRRRGADLRAVVHRVELRRQDRDQDQGQERRRQATPTATGSPWAATS